MDEFIKMVFFYLCVYMFLQRQTVVSSEQKKEWDLDADITKLTRDSSGTLYLGGDNFIAKFSSNLNDSLSVISIGPGPDADDCLPQTAPCNNTVKVLEVVEQLQMLLVCGTAYNGTCTLHNLDNMSDWYCLVGDLDTDAAVMASVNNRASVIKILPTAKADIFNLPNESTKRATCRYHDFGYIKPNASGSPMHIPNRSHATHKDTKPGQNVLGVQLLVAGDLYSPNPLTPSVTVMSIRNITFKGNEFIVNYARNSLSEMNQTFFKTESGSKFSIDFTYSFAWNNFTYLLSIHHIGGDNKTRVTKLGRVSANNANALRYVETQLECSVDNETYTEMTAATFTNLNVPSNKKAATVPVLLVAFGANGDARPGTSEPRNGGALCAFFIEEIDVNLESAINSCSSGVGTQTRQVDWIKLPKQRCQNNSPPKNHGVYLQMASGQTREAMLRRNTTITALYISESKATGALYLFLVTNDGIMEKNLLNVGNSGKQKLDSSFVEKFEVTNYTKDVNLCVQSNEKFINVYMTVGSQLVRRPVHDCQQFQGCRHCSSETCNWCYSTRVCQEKGTLCQDDRQEDKPSNGSWITPTYAPPQGGTILTMYGLASIRNATVKICDAPCDIINSSGSTITCEVQPLYPANESASCKIILETSCKSTIRNRLTLPDSLTFVTPSIESRSPSNGSDSGETLLEFKGCYLDVGSSTQVRLGGSSCNITELSRDRIKCITGPKPVNHNVCVSAQVKVDNFSYISTNPFCYDSDHSIVKEKTTIVAPASNVENEGGLTKTPALKGSHETKIDSFSPLFGPVSGGTRLTFKTQHLNVTTRIKITLGNGSCSGVFTNNQTITCIAGRHVNATTECVKVLITLNDVLQNVQLQPFCYKPNPVVTQVEVGTILHSEDINVTVAGSNFDSVASSKIVISFHDHITNKSLSLSGGCFPGNRNESMTCVISDLYNITEEYFKANVSGDYLDAELAIEMDNNYFNINESLRKLKLKIYRSPKFDNDTVQKTKLSLNDPILVFSVPNLTMFNREDITVKVGNQVCRIVMLTESSLKCDAGNAIGSLQKKQADLDRQPKNDTGSNASSDGNALDGCSRLRPDERDLQCAVTLQIGNQVTELGHVTISLDPLSETVKTMAMVGTCLVAIVIVSLLVLTVVLLTRLKREKLKKCQTIGGPGVDLISSGLGEAAMPTLQQILESVDVDKSRQEEMRKLIFDFDKLTLGKCIGSGNFGTVFDGLLEISPELPAEKVAVKMLQDPMSHKLDLLNFVQEAVMMRQFQHPNVLGLIGLTEQEPGIPFVILPFLENGDLLTYVRNQSLRLTLHDVIRFGADIAYGMAYLSSLKFVHRDLAARNCMLDGEYRVKVADFGLCRDIYEKGYYTSDNKKILPIRWMALESIEDGTYTTKSDVWSLGVVIWEMLTRGLTPYPGVDGWDVVNYLRHRRLPPPYFCPESLFNLMMMCWAKEPNRRPSFKAIQMELLLLVDAGRDDSPPKKENPYTPFPSKQPVTQVSETSINTPAQPENLSQESNTRHGDVTNENEQSYPTKDETILSGEDTRLTSSHVSDPHVHDTQVNDTQVNDTQVNDTLINDSQVNDREVKDRKVINTQVNETQTHDKHSANESNGSEMLSFPKKTAAQDVLITIPECYSHVDVSSEALGVYVELVANYEPPKTFLSTFISPSPGCSLTGPDFINEYQSDAAKEYVWLSEEGAYYKPDEEI
ncbi:unnamed protein product [Lymnaea stagnalis]|uniref:receptor protein-tyrosine kinase n=1 Tax=Lymnaea stagnalis TaxID=6523 RepID=A0AAV2H5A9_LYMST